MAEKRTNENEKIEKYVNRKVLRKAVMTIPKSSSSALLRSKNSKVNTPVAGVKELEAFSPKT